MATPRMDPSILEIADIIRYPAAEEAFLREFGLVPTPSARPQATGTLQGRPSACEYWGICKDLGFNPGEPGCDGEVVTYNRRCKKGIRPSFKCNRCKKQLSQLRGTDALHAVVETDSPKSSLERRERTSLPVVLVLFAASTFIDVNKMVCSYSLRYYNHGSYPMNQSLMVALTEVFKCVLVTAVRMVTSGSLRMRPSSKFLVPSLIYMLTNNIFFIALHYVTPAVWIVLAQCRIFFTLFAYNACWSCKAHFQLCADQLTGSVPFFLVATIVFSAAYGLCATLVVARLDNVVKYHLSATSSLLNMFALAALFPDQFRITLAYVVLLFLLMVAIYLYEKMFVLPHSLDV
ncbi:hypothetical protein HPB52_017049 [Rhipicephalus sanguineus]|uniref:Uncharacterized protein n=1 Tax=Rhipicephalus sanguineus TaxID=34632 RepID=A0A9D4T7S5_RHISA|nr:hypothetical protein HPB52_017049 [Rhipicephalus sanguineus]